MAERPDLRQIAVSIGEALEGFDQSDLASMLTYVFKEYVVEGAPPILVSQVDGIEALEGLSFAELIEQLQARLDLPELEHFSVQGNQVMVRAGGVMTAIGGDSRGARPAAPEPAPVAAPTASESPTAAAQSGSAPPPSRGLSIGSRPMAGGGASPMATPTSPSPASSQASDAAAEPPEKTEEPPPAGDDDASVRFSLLELD